MRFLNTKVILQMVRMAAVAAFLVGVIACSNDEDRPPPSASDSDSPAPTVRPTPDRRDIVGRVGATGDSVKPLAFVDDREAFLSADIFRGSLIRTDQSGLITYSLDLQANGQVTCDTREDSLLEVLAPDGAIIRWFSENGVGISGQSICAKSGSASEHRYTVGDRITIVTIDPIFAVGFDGRDVALKLVHGRLTVAVASERFELTAGQQLFVPGDAEPVVQILELNAEESASVSRLQALVPLPDLTLALDNVDGTGESCQVEFTVSNEGKAIALESSTRVTIGSLTTDETTPSLEPGESATITAAFDQACPFVPDLRGSLSADFGDALAERDETNNDASIDIIG